MQNLTLNFNLTELLYCNLSKRNKLKQTIKLFAFLKIFIELTICAKQIIVQSSEPVTTNWTVISQ